MRLTVQNGPDEILNTFTGRQRYRWTHRALHFLMPLCYGVCYDHLSCVVFPLGPPQDLRKQSPHTPVELKVKWVLRGHHHPPFSLYNLPGQDKTSSSSSEPLEMEVLLEAYCFYTFDRCSGRVVSHVIDYVAAVPPVDLQLELDLVQPYWLGQRQVPDATAATAVVTPNPSCQRGGRDHARRCPYGHHDDGGYYRGDYYNE